MFVLFRRNRERIAIVVGLCALGLTAWTWFMQDSGASRGRMFYGTDTRITPVLVGATLAFMLARLHREEPVEVSAARSDWQPWLEAAGIAGAVWVGWFLLTSVPHDEFMYHGGYFLFAIATACLIAASLHPRSQVLRPILSWRVLGAVGVVSYGLYLYHLPVFYWITPAHVSLNGYAIVGLRIVVTATLAIASFVLVERRFRHAHFRPAVTWVLIATAAVVAVAAILVATSTKSDIVVVEPGSDPNPATLIALRRIGDGAPPGSTKLLVAGDGAAFGLGSAVRNRYEGDKVFGTTFADLQCGLAEGTLEVFGEAATNLPACRQWPDQYQAAVEAVRPDVVALMIGNREPFNRIIDGETVVFGSDEWKQQLRAELDRARAGLTASGAHLMLLTVPCPAGVEDSTLTSEQRSESRRHRINEELREYAAEHAPDVSIGDLGAMLCSPGGWKARTDNLHFTPAGARQTWAWLGEQARQAVRG